jgi:hypothetical protein
VSDTHRASIGLGCIYLVIIMVECFLSCVSFKVLGLILRSLIHFELMFVQGERPVSSLSLLQAIIQFLQEHLLKKVSFLHQMVCASLPKTGGCSCKDICLGLLLCTTGLCVWFLVPVQCCFY